MEEYGASEIFCFDEEQLSNTFTDVEVIYSSVNSVVLRAKRNGQWWTLKGIGEGCENLEIRRNCSKRSMTFSRHSITQTLRKPLAWKWFLDMAGVLCWNGWMVLICANGLRPKTE